MSTGAVTLALPQDVQAEAYDWPEEFFAERVWAYAAPPRPDRAGGGRPRRTGSARPLIIAGGGIRHSAAGAALAEFAQATGIPVASTQAGKGVLPWDHPADVGGIGHTGTATADALAREADLVIAAGTRLTDFTTASATLFQHPGVRFLGLNLDPYDAHKLAARPLVCDAREGLEELRAAVAGYRVDPPYETAYKEGKRAWERLVDRAYAAPDEDGVPTQAQVLGLLDGLVDGDDILINAAGSLPGDLHKLWRARSADQYHVEYGYSCMGYEIPAAIGTALAAPGRPVWALVGDGTYLMNPTEIVTAVQEGIPVKLVILDNHGYASIGGLSDAVGGEGFATAYRFRAVDGSYSGAPLPVDLAANAASLGMAVIHPRTIGDLRKALAEARSADRPTCVYVQTRTPDTVSGPPPHRRGGMSLWPRPRPVRRRPRPEKSTTGKPRSDVAICEGVRHEDRQPLDRWQDRRGRVGQLRPGHRPGHRRGHHPGRPRVRRRGRRGRTGRQGGVPVLGQSSLAARTKVLFAYRALLDANRDAIADLIVAEHGKVHSDALGEVARGLEIVELACGITVQLKGELSTSVSSRVDVSSIRQPIGVVAGITPFNFPAMVPMWMFPLAVACGNTFILKPSEKDPSASTLLAQLASQAGLPAGVLNVVHGDKVAVDALLSHPDVAAVSFVGSTPIARHIHTTASANGKRVQALGGAKNHMLVLPDADLDAAADAAVSAAYGSAGERCMAISAVVAVGSIADTLVDKIRERAEKIKIGPGNDPTSEMGPLITAAHRDKVASYVTGAAAQGADVVLDGTGYTVEGNENGHWIGLSLLDNVKTDSDAYRDEIFGPVLCVLRVDTYEEGVALMNASPFGNGTAIFTRDGGAARRFQLEIEAGMVGVNVPIPVPVGYHSFGGWKDSLFGDLHIYGNDGIQFYTRGKVVTTRWPDPSDAPAGVDLGFPRNH